MADSESSPTQSSDADEIVVRHRPDQGRFDLLVGDTLAGHTEYRERGRRYLFTHTEIVPAFEGQGLGSRLAAGTLDQVRALGVSVVPLCAFVERYIERHSEYGDLVDQRMLERLEALDD